MLIFTKIKNPKIPQPNPTAFSPLGGAFVSTQEKKKKKDTPTRTAAEMRSRAKPQLSP